MLKIFCNKGIKVLLFSAIVFGLEVLSLSSTFAQRGMSVTIFGMPQRTFMYRKPGGDNAAEIAKTYAPDESREIIKTPSYNFAFGFLIKHSFAKRFGIVYGVSYAAHEQNYRTFVVIDNREVNFGIKLKYIKIPFLFQCNYVAKEKYQLFLKAGPQLNVLFSENGGIPVYAPKPPLPIFDIVDPGGAYHNFVLSGVVATGGEIKLDNKTSLFLRAYLDYSLTPVEKKSFEEIFIAANRIFEYPNVTISTKHNITFGISLGLTFKIRE